VEQDDDQCDGDGQNMMSKAPTWNRRKRKKTYGDEGKGTLL
jgi:hypothetical protein